MVQVAAAPFWTKPWIISWGVRSFVPPDKSALAGLSLISPRAVRGMESDSLSAVVEPGVSRLKSPSIFGGASREGKIGEPSLRRLLAISIS